MKSVVSRVTPALWIGLILSGLPTARGADARPQPRDPRIQIRRLTTVNDVAPPCRIAKDPRDQRLYYMTLGGSIYRLTVQPGEDQSLRTRIADSSHHAQTNTMGFDIGPDGTFYVVANQTQSTNSALTAAYVLRGEERPGTEGRLWSVVAHTEPYARSKTAFDHVFNAVEVSPDGATLYLNSGSRTDHGEIQSADGAFPGLREEPLNAAIFRVPARGNDILLPRDLNALKADGRIYCEGIRNTFDLRFSPSGELFGAENGPDRGMSDELNWLREGEHYGFPWRMGGADNPQQFPDYDPALDKLLDSRFTAVKGGYFNNDPTFPPAPDRMLEPIGNLGPDADKFRDPIDGLIKDASDLGMKLFTFTTHRSPLGLVFDEDRALAAPYRGCAFAMGFMGGDETGDRYPGPFQDASRDLLRLRLHKTADNYDAEVYKLVTGFVDPIDSEIIGNVLYVICYGGERAIWEITLPAADAVELTAPIWTPLGLAFTLNVGTQGLYALQVSSNLLDWTTLWTPTFPSGSSYFLDGSAATNAGARFYRTWKP
ncbi:MAG: PQQ-dependent sugar dehydrogenase [Verrucomicrobiales bacterium]|nr:PQQ-dependent sugar dehydrogenase [Verrucomicrobiales bacterium]